MSNQDFDTLLFQHSKRLLWHFEKATCDNLTPLLHKPLHKISLEYIFLQKQNFCFFSGICYANKFYSKIFFFCLLFVFLFPIPFYDTYNKRFRLHRSNGFQNGDDKKHNNNFNYKSRWIIRDKSIEKLQQYVIWMYTNDARRVYRIFVDAIILSVVVEFSLALIVLPTNYR